jgi:hypothetical protein
VTPALRVHADALELDVEAHRQRRAADRQIAARGVETVALREDRVALEDDLGVALRREEVG